MQFSIRLFIHFEKFSTISISVEANSHTIVLVRIFEAFEYSYKPRQHSNSSALGYLCFQHQHYISVSHYCCYNMLFLCTFKHASNRQQQKSSTPCSDILALKITQLQGTEGTRKHRLTERGVFTSISYTFSSSSVHTSMRRSYMSANKSRLTHALSCAHSYSPKLVPILCNFFYGR